MLGNMSWPQYLQLVDCTGGDGLSYTETAVYLFFHLLKFIGSSPGDAWVLPIESDLTAISDSG